MWLTVLLTIVTLDRNAGEVCRFPAGDHENPFRRWLASSAVTCVAAGSPMTFPPGAWNVFGRSGNALSTAPVLVDGAAPPPALSLSLQPAAVLTAILPDGHRGVVYAPRSGSAFPVGTIVPAEQDLWLFIMKESELVAAIPVSPLEPGSERKIDARGGWSPMVATWLHVPSADREALRTARGISAPLVRLTSAAPAIDAEPSPPLELLNGSFVFVRGVSAGETEIDVSGRGWLPDRHRVRIGSSIVTFVDEPLVARGASTLLVRWNAADDMPALNRSLGSCNATDERPEEFEISVAACPKPDDCHSIHKETSIPEIDFGTFSLDDVPPGTYRTEVRFGKLPPASRTVEALPFQQIPVNLSAFYVTLYGSVTRGGEPLGEPARLRFPADGVGYSRDNGEYNAVLLRAIETDDRIDVSACDGTPAAIVLADRPARNGQRLDIDIPENRLTITVSDTFTRAPLEATSVRYVVMSASGPRRPVITQQLTTDAAGRIVIESVPEREIHLLVTRSGYQRRMVAPFSMSKSEKKSVDVQLVPLNGKPGKIISRLPFQNAVILWFSPTGFEIERADVSANGSFVYTSEHHPDEIIVVASQSHPLLIRPAGAPPIQFPDAPGRTFEITAPVRIVVGGLTIPQSALRLHQSMQPSPRVVAIVETGPIEVSRDGV